MAVTTQKSVQYTNATAVPVVNNEPNEMAGRVRIAYAVHDQSGAGDAGSSVALFRLPAGKVRVLLNMSSFYVNWTTASAALDLGWDAYVGRDGTPVVADPDGLVDGQDVDAAGYKTPTPVAALAASGGTKVFDSREGVVIRATSPTAIASGDDFAGYLAFVID